MSTLQKWLYNHGIVSIGLIIWCVALTTYVTIRIFSDSPPDIPTGTVAAYGTLLGLPTLAVGVWKWRSDKP